jgi:CarD family transcriptional regulator
MKFKVGSKVFYPSHGAGVIKREKEIEFDGDKKKYFEFQLITNPLSISTPVDNVDNLGIREVLSLEKIEKALKTIKKIPTVDPEAADFNKLIKIFKELEESPDIEASIQIIQYCNFVKEKRKQEGRLIPVTIEKQLEGAIRNIVGEIAVSEGITLKTASEKFTKFTGLEIEEVEE